MIQSPIPYPTYMSNSEKPYRLGVNVIIVDTEDHFLIIQKVGYADNEWNFIGGGREEGESLEQNMYREIEEELELKESDFELVGVSTHKITYDYPAELALRVNGGKYRGQSYDQVVLRFMGDKGKIKYSEVEFRDHKWVEGSELVKYLVFPNQYDNHRVAIEEILQEKVQV